MEYTGIHQASGQYTGIDWNRWNTVEYTRLVNNILEYTGIHWNTLKYTGIHWNTLNILG